LIIERVKNLNVSKEERGEKERKGETKKGRKEERRTWPRM
tara:strand:+ start:166 stop:285 length:120 start_codon:yes stop_codon:yes gene_type:complete